MKRKITLPILEDPTKTKSIRDRYARLSRNLIAQIYKIIIRNLYASSSYRFEAFQDPVEVSEGEISSRMIDFVISKIPSIIPQAFDFGVKQAERNISKKITPLGPAIREPETVTRLIEQGIVAPLPPRREIPGFTQMNMEQVNKLIDVNADLITSVARNLVSQIRLIIHNGLINGRSKNQISNEIMRIANNRRSEADRIARTEVIRAYTTGSMRRYIAEGITHWQWQASSERKTRPYGSIMVRDPKVCHICRRLHGEIREIGQSFGTSEKMRGNVIIKPPDVHPLCRCTIVPHVPPKKRKPSGSYLTRMRKMVIGFEDDE